MKIIDLSTIPKINNKYDWKNSIGCVCKFVYSKIEGELTIVDYKKEPKRSLLLITYGNTSGWIPTTQFVRGGIGGVLKMHTSDFKYNIGEILHQKTDIQILSCEKRCENERNRKYYTYKCLQCGEINTTTEAILLKGSGCPYCAHRKLKVGVNDITTTDPWMIPFFENKQEASQYTFGSTKQIYPYCPVCRKKQTKPKMICQLYESHRSGCTCDTYMSFPEQIVFNLLIQNQIHFIHRATYHELPWANQYEYDFYLPESNIIIETHGAQHYLEHGFSRLGGKTLEEQQQTDKLKEELAKLNNVDYYIIDCRKSKLDFILENILASPIAAKLNLQIKNKKDLYVNTLMYKKQQLNSLLKNDIPYTKKQLAEKIDVSLLILNRLLGGEELA